LPEVQCLPSALNQVFLNLLVNAAQAIGAERGNIRIRTGVDGAQVWVEIADNGAGIAAENLQKIFDPFSPPSLLARAPAWACHFRMALCKSTADV
jgi:two-component system, NtrC family, sensor kinase